MPLYLCKWPNSDVVFANAPNRAALNQLLDAADDPGTVVVKKFKGRFALEFKHKLPGGHITSVERLKPKHDGHEQQLCERMWQLRGSFCDLTLCSANGCTQQVHKIIVAATSSWFAKHVTEYADKLHVPCLKTKADLDALVSFLYLRKLQSGYDAAALLQAADEYSIPGLAESVDYDLGLAFESNDTQCQFPCEAAKKVKAQQLLHNLILAQRFNRGKLLAFCMQHLEPQGFQWMTDMEQFDSLPLEFKQQIQHSAYRRMPCIYRGIGLRAVPIPANVYKEAGGKLYPEEEQQLDLWQHMSGVGWDVLRSDECGESDAPCAPRTWEVTTEDLECSRVRTEGTVDYELVTDAPYHEFYTFISKMTKFAFPHTAAATEGDDGLRLRAAISRDVDENWKGGKLSGEEMARLVAAAEVGNKEAAVKVALGIPSTACSMSGMESEDESDGSDDEEDITDFASLDAIIRGSSRATGSTNNHYCQEAASPPNDSYTTIH